MARKIAVRPIEPLILEFEDGTELEAIFTVEALMIIQDEFGDIEKLTEREMDRPYDLAAKILYAGCKAMDNSVTLEQCKAIVIGGGIPLISAIFEELLVTYDGLDDDVETIKKK